jgi:DNA-binding winged helix-turn-helix (wHTH) protein
MPATTAHDAYETDVAWRDQKSQRNTKKLPKYFSKKRAMGTIHTFGPFRLQADAEILFRGSEPLPVGRRAVALLRVLVERPGEPVSKDALIEAAWAGLAVGESNLPVQIAALRKVLGDGDEWIETLPRRGYRYIGPLPRKTEVEAPAALHSCARAHCACRPRRTWPHIARGLRLCRSERC